MRGGEDCLNRRILKMSDDVRLDLLKDTISESGLDGQTRDALAEKHAEKKGKVK